MANTTQQLPLADIHLPDPIGFWPLAPGWWVVIVLLLVVIATAAIWSYRHLWVPARQRKLRRQQAQAWVNRLQIQMHNLNLEDASQRQQYLIELQTCLKLWMKTHAPHNLNLIGKPWLTALDQYCVNAFNKDSLELLMKGHYQNPESIALPALQTLHEQSCRWLLNADPTAKPQTTVEASA